MKANRKNLGDENAILDERIPAEHLWGRRCARGLFESRAGHLMEVDVRAFGNQLMDAPNLKVRGFPVDTSKFGCPKNLQPIFGAVRRCLDFNARRDRCGRGSLPYYTWTWYTQLGGILAKPNYGIPLVITIHSLEPFAPLETRTAGAWLFQQLG